jgi:succinate dehydrogenase/fumarate reductase flavoprotein subunit
MSDSTATLQCDVLVIGSGAGGLSAAVIAAKRGLKVIVVEKEAQFGGTSAWSGGWMWIPRNHLALAAGIDEPVDEARRYLQYELGEFFNPVLVDTYLKQAPDMVAYFSANTALEFILGDSIADMHSDSPGAATDGRTIGAAPYDGRELGSHLQLLKPPLQETTIWGMAVAPGHDINQFYEAQRSWSAFKYAMKRVLKHFRSRLKHGRGTHLVNGNALIARLAKSALDFGVDIRVGHPVESLIHSDGSAVGANVNSGSGQVSIHAGRAVILACGGFPHDNQRKRELLSHTHTGEAHWSAAAPGNTGDGLRFAEALGAEVIAERSAAALAPVSLVPRDNGSYGHFPHLFERGKPGLIAVNRLGKRFTNESNSHFDFMSDLFTLGLTESWLICDHRFIRRWGLGAVKPAPMPFQIGKFITNGYLVRARSIKALAERAVIDPISLVETVERYNLLAAKGIDEDFKKGETHFNRMQGDATHQPNPCMAPILKAPFYALKLLPGSLGTFAGLRTNEFAQVLNHQDQPIDRLYAVGNDMASIMGGNYPSGGIALGPAMTFGYIAANHIAQSSSESASSVIL